MGSILVGGAVPGGPHSSLPTWAPAGLPAFHTHPEGTRYLSTWVASLRLKPGGFWLRDPGSGLRLLPLPLTQQCPWKVPTPGLTANLSSTYFPTWCRDHAFE